MEYRPGPVHALNPWRSLYLAGWICWLLLSGLTCLRIAAAEGFGSAATAGVVLLVLAGIADAAGRLLLWLGRSLFRRPQPSPRVAQNGQQVIVIKQGGCAGLGCAGSFLALLGLFVLAWIVLNLAGLALALLGGVLLL